MYRHMIATDTKPLHYRPLSNTNAIQSQKSYLNGKPPHPQIESKSMNHPPSKPVEIMPTAQTTVQTPQINCSESPTTRPPKNVNKVAEANDYSPKTKPQENGHTTKTLVNKSESFDTIQKTAEQTSRLTARQKDILVKTFIPMNEDAVRNGLKILYKLFSEHPRYKLIWPQFRAIPDSSLINATELRRHSSVYMGALNSIINSMYHEDDLAGQLNRIAKAHIKWNIHRSHIIHMLVPVLEVVKECNGYQLDDETTEAWTTLYDVIANLIDVYRNKTPVQKPVY